MDPTDTNSLVTFLCGLAIVIGIVGVIVPVLPGLLLCWLGVLGWAIFADAGWGRWLVLAIVTVLALTATVVKYAWPGRNLRRTGIPNRSLVAGGALGLVGFFVVPVVGLVLGFLLGVWLAERMRLKDPGSAWGSAKHALRAAGLSMLIELGAALGIAFVWGVGLAVA